MLKDFKLTFDSFIVGFIAFPVTYYVVKNFGAVLWQDIKTLAYKLWDLTKSKTGI